MAFALSIRMEPLLSGEAEGVDAPESETNEPETPTDAAESTGEDQRDWKAFSRKNEAAAKAARAENAQLRAELDEFRKASMSETERAIAEAREAGRLEALSTASREVAAAKVAVHLAGAGLPASLVEVLDVDKFVTPDGVDSDAISAAVSALAEATGANKPNPAQPTPGAQGQPAGPKADFLSAVFGR